MKHILCDREIKLWIRVKILESTVRARLLYAAQTDLLNAAEHAKLDSIWHQYLRKMVKGGFQRKNAPPRESKKKKAERLAREAENPELKEQWDWGYKITNEKLRKICGATPIGELADKFHLKYVAHAWLYNHSNALFNPAVNICENPNPLLKMSYLANFYKNQFLFFQSQP